MGTINHLNSVELLFSFIPFNLSSFKLTCFYLSSLNIYLKLFLFLLNIFSDR